MVIGTKVYSVGRFIIFRIFNIRIFGAFRRYILL